MIMMTNPIGTAVGELEIVSLNVGIVMGGACVYVAILVGIGVVMNCAARVGSMVSVYCGVGCGGGSTTGSSPGVIETRGA